MKAIAILTTLFFSLIAQAQDPLPHEPSPERMREISEHNQQQSLFEPFFSSRAQKATRPFAEYEKTGYLFFDDDDYRGYAKEIKRTLAENLPEGVTLVVYSTSRNQNYLAQLKSRYSQYIDDSRLMILQVPRSGSNSFWTRDSLPIPVWNQQDMSLVDARYYYNFEPDQFIANLFSVDLSSHQYFFEGGNFITNSKGDCIVVNRRRSYPGGISDTAAIPDSIFYNQYGCQKLIRFKHLKGIGHSDEVVKFMSDNIIVTDTEEYVKTLEDEGYEVVLLPEPDRRYETYVNSLQVNDVLFVPVFGESHDQKAVQAYEDLDLGLKIVTIPTRLLATRGQGGIHCITMNYPPANIQALVSAMGGRLIEE
ncbi:MAG: agmatine deiminase family protein [Pseudomonadota bacterium]